MPPLIEERQTSRLMDSWTKSKLSGTERRAGGEDRAQPERSWVFAGARPAFLTASMYLAEVPKIVDALLGHVVEERVAVGLERRAVVERERRLAGERAHQPVPHHPAAGGEVEDAPAALHVAVQGKLLDVLQQRPARSVHDALRRPGGPGGVHDVERMVEREALELDPGRSVAGDEVIQDDRPVHRCDVGRGGGVRHHHDALDGRYPLGDRSEPGDGIEPLAAVEVAVGAEQHLRLDLTEAVHNPLHAEIGRGGRPDRADARGGEHRDDRLRHVGQVAGDGVALRHPRRSQRLREHGHVVVELAEGQRASDAVLAAKQDRGRVVAAAEQVLGEVEPGAGKPLRAWHPVAVDQYRSLAPVADDLAVLPDRGPERGAVLDRPAVQCRVVAGVHSVPLPHQCREAGEVGVRDPFRRGLPEHLRHCRVLGDSGCADPTGNGRCGLTPGAGRGPSPPGPSPGGRGEKTRSPGWRNVK